MRDRIKHWLILIIGWTFLVLGVAGFFLPVLQGLLFTFIGLGILSSRSRWARRMTARLRARYPRHYHTIRRKKEALKKKLQRMWAPGQGTPGSS